MSLLLWFFLCLLLFSHMVNWSIDFLILYFLGFIKIPVCMNQCLSWLLENSQSALTCQIWPLSNFLSPYLLKLRHMLDYLTLFFISLNYSFTCSISLVLQAAFYYFFRFFFQFTIVAHVVKNPPTMQETGIQSLDQKDPLRREWLPTPVLLPGEFHGQRSLAGYSPWGRPELVMTERLTLDLTIPFADQQL